MPYRGKNRGKGDLLPRKKLRFSAFYHGSLGPEAPASGPARLLCIRSIAAWSGRSWPFGHCGAWFQPGMTTIMSTASPSLSTRSPATAASRRPLTRLGKPRHKALSRNGCGLLVARRTAARQPETRVPASARAGRWRLPQTNQPTGPGPTAIRPHLPAGPPTTAVDRE